MSSPANRRRRHTATADAGQIREMMREFTALHTDPRFLEEMLYDERVGPRDPHADSLHAVIEGHEDPRLEAVEILADAERQVRWNIKENERLGNVLNGEGKPRVPKTPEEAPVLCREDVAGSWCMRPVNHKGLHRPHEKVAVVQKWSTNHPERPACTCGATLAQVQADPAKHWSVRCQPVDYKDQDCTCHRRRKPDPLHCPQHASENWAKLEAGGATRAADAAARLGPLAVVAVAALAVLSLVGCTYPGDRAFKARVRAVDACEHRTQMRCVDTPKGVVPTDERLTP